MNTTAPSPIDLRLVLSLLCACPCHASADGAIERYADFGWKGPAAMKRDLDRAADYVAAHPQGTVEILLHGSDVHAFASGSARPDVLRRATVLAQAGRVRFRVCDLALTYEGLALSDLPAYVGRLPYVPARVIELRAQGARALGLDQP